MTDRIENVAMAIAVLVVVVAFAYRDSVLLAPSKQEDALYAQDDHHAGCSLCEHGCEE